MRLGQKRLVAVADGSVKDLLCDFVASGSGARAGGSGVRARASGSGPRAETLMPERSRGSCYYYSTPLSSALSW